MGNHTDFYGNGVWQVFVGSAPSTRRCVKYTGIDKIFRVHLFTLIEIDKRKFANNESI